MNKTDEVFGISRELPLNYVERPTADGVLVDSLTRDKHLVIFGSSKQGKTSLRKHALNDNDYIVAHCSNKWTISDVHNAILKKAGFELTQSSSKSASGKSKIFAKLTAGLFGSSVEGGGEAEREHRTETTTAPLELDSEDVNDVIEALKAISFRGYIVLEDFHYLPIETQKNFAVTLKAFHEESKFCFIIVGVWLEENRLTVYNGDLTGRVISVNADRWERGELAQVIAIGEKLLNVDFAPDFRDALLDTCFGSVSILQETCYQCCKKNGVNETLMQRRFIGSKDDVRILISDVVAQQTGRFNGFITQFADGFQSTQLEMYKWLLYPILIAKVDDLMRGLKYSEMRKTIQGRHPQGVQLNLGNLTQALQSCAALQVKKDVKPIVLDYDETNSRLRVVDSSFLIWLDMQDRADLLDLAGLPVD